ncbi:MAG: PIG-L deacetylase family protein [Tepidisphaeraceae bacterium]
MIRLNLFKSVRNVLCLGAHCDDIEIGCGATVLHAIDQNPDLNFLWVVFSGDAARHAEARAGAADFLGGAASTRVAMHGFHDGNFPFDGSNIKGVFESLKGEFSPDLIFTHYREDRHQDHQLISNLTWNTWRDHLILEYEIPKYDGDLGHPNLFVPFDEQTARRKTDLLIDAFPSQRGRHWFSADTFLSLMRLRGVECAAPSQYAEAFHARKLTV